MLISENKANFDRSSLESIKIAYENLSVKDFKSDTVKDALFYAADAYPEKPALIMLSDSNVESDPHIVDYKTLKAELIKAGNYLQSLGVKPGDPVAFLCPPSTEGLIFFWASLSFASIAPINPLLSAEVIAEICNELNVKVIVSPQLESDEICEKMSNVFSEAKTVEHIVCETYRHGFNVCQNLHLTSERNSFSGKQLPEYLPDADTIAAYFHTGGTTGIPKVAKTLNRNIISGVVQTHLPAGITSDHVTVNGIPLFHVGGGVIITTGCIALGQTLVQLSPLGYRTPGITDNFWKIVVKYGVTQVIAVPTVYQDILRSYSGEKTKISRFISSASKLPTSVLNKVKETFGLDILEGYGMTECTGFCSSSVTGLPVKPGATGVAVPNFTIRTGIIENGRIQRFCEPNEVGNILVQGAGVFAGYTDPEKNKARFIKDNVSGEVWLNSEDLGRIDDDGYLFVVGRSKDLIIRSGHNIDPATIEEVLLGFPGVIDAAAVGMPDQRAGELPISFVVLEKPEDFDEEALKQWCRNHIKESGAVPLYIVLLEEMPRTAMNKIFKPSLAVEATKIGIARLLGHALEESVGASIKVKAKKSGQILIKLAAKDKPNNGSENPIDSLFKKLSVLGLEITVSP